MSERRATERHDAERAAWHTSCHQGATTTLPSWSGAPYTRRITDERLGHDVAGRLACALPSAEALDYLRRHLRAPLLTVAAGPIA